MRKTTALLLALFAFPVLASCGNEDSPQAASPSDVNPPAASTWQAAVAFEAPDGLGGCAVGDLDPTRSGNEIAAVCRTGDIYLVHREPGGTWKGEVIAHAPGEMIQCAIGDADPTRDGDEMIVVGVSEGGEDSGATGEANIVYRGEDGWRLESIFEDTALIHGVCIGDVDDALRGNEVVTVGFSNNATVLHRDGDGWRKVIALPLGSPGKTAVFFRGGAAVACAGGTVTVVEKKEGDVWETAVINESDAGRARIATDGHRILVACDDGGLRLLDEGLTTEIYRETDKLRGAVLADLDPYVDGIEAATAGYGKTMTVLYPGEDKWTPVTLVRDTGRFHHLTCGELLEAGAGKELVGCSYSGRVIVASRVPE